MPPEDLCIRYKKSSAIYFPYINLAPRMGGYLGEAAGNGLPKFEVRERPMLTSLQYLENTI